METKEMAEEMLATLCELARTPVRQIRGITGGELGTLGYLVTGWGGAAPSDISRDFCISTARATNIISGLERKGWVERHPDPDDRRRVSISVTDSGRAMVTDHMDRVLRDLRRLLDGLGEDDAKEFLRLVKRVVSLCGTLPLESVAAANITGGVHT